MIYRVYYLLLVNVLSTTTILSQDLRSGEIVYKHLSGYTYQADLYLYQDTSTYFSRTVRLYWGDGTIDTLQGGIGGCIVNGVFVSHYVGTHTYPGFGTFVISYSDSFLVTNITNINNSNNEKLYLENKFVINPFLGYNNSVVLLNCQDVKWECCTWVHNPGAVEPDGDSLSYSLAPWYTSNYTFPPATVNPITGDFTMSPSSTGIYAAAIQIDEWRKVNNQYYNIGYTTRYMLLNVPSLSSVNENNLSTQINIYPNPAQSELTIEVTEDKGQGTGEYACSIKNLLGQTLAEKTFIGKTSFDVSNWAKGMYFIELKDEKGARAGAEKVVVE